MANIIKIKFQADGAKALVAAINQLAVAQTRLNQGTKKAELLQKKLNKELDKYGKNSAFATRNNRLLTNTFATLRSKLLLVSFGFTLIAGSIGKALKMYGEQEKAILKLETALGHSSEKLQTLASDLQRISGVGDEVIIASQSIIASFVRNEKAVGDLSVAALDLSTALGLDLNAAANLIGKTIGSSTNAMSRYGVSVVGAANSTKRIESLLTNVNIMFGGLAEAAGSKTSGSLDRLADSAGDFIEKLGELLVSLGAVSAINFLTTSFQALQFAIDGTLGVLGLNNKQLEEAVEMSRLSADAHNEEVQNIKSLTSITAVRNKILEKEGELADLVALGITNKNNADQQSISNSKDLKSSFQDEVDALKDRLGTLDKSLLIQSTGSEQTVFSNKQVEKTVIAVKKAAAAQKSYALIQAELIMLQAKQQELFVKGEAQLKAMAISQNNLAVATGNMSIHQAAINNLNAEFVEFHALKQEGLLTEEQIQTRLNELDLKAIAIAQKKREEEMKSVTITIDSMQQVTSALVSNLDKQFKAEMDNEKDKASWDKMSDNAKEARENSIAKKYQGRRTALFLADKALALSELYINTELAAMKAMGQAGLFGVPMSTFIRAQGIVSGIIIASQKAPQYEYGGMVGGNRHSAGGTLIEAEQGEFVMNRNAVDSIGVGALNAMNQGGGGVTVNVSGNVLTQDFVEGELAESIQEAVRKGVSFA